MSESLRKLTLIGDRATDLVLQIIFEADLDSEVVEPQIRSVIRTAILRRENYEGALEEVVAAVKRRHPEAERKQCGTCGICVALAELDKLIDSLGR